MNDDAEIADLCGGGPCFSRDHGEGENDERVDGADEKAFGFEVLKFEFEGALLVLEFF